MHWKPLREHPAVRRGVSLALPRPNGKRLALFQSQRSGDRSALFRWIQSGNIRHYVLYLFAAARLLPALRANMVKLSSDPSSWLAYALFLAAAPLLSGIVNKLKARLSGRSGPTIFQPYFELLRLARKETVYSTSAGFISRLAPAMVWCTVAFAALLLPLGHQAAVTFPGEIILFAYVLALGRFFQILAALDVASSFEGMGASREARFAVFAEPIFFFTIGSLAIVTRRYSFEADLHRNFLA